MDSEDLESAKLGEAVLMHLYRALKRQSKNKRYLGWLLTTGNAAASVFWNPELGRVLPFTMPVEVTDPESGDIKEIECPCDEKGEPYLLEDGSPDLEHPPIMQNEGDVDLVIENILAIRWDPDAESLEDTTECFVAYAWPRQKVMDTFGLTEAELDASKDDELEAYLNLHSAAAAGADDILGVALGSSQEDARGQLYLVLKYFGRPSDKYPEGRHWIQVGKRLAGEEEPLPEGFWPPVVMCQDTPIPGQLHAIGLIPQCVPINEQYNYLDGKILEHDVQMAMGGIWFCHPADKGITISTDPGQVKVSKGLAQNPPCPPVQAKMLPLPDAVYEEREKKLALLQYIAGTNDIGTGQKPEGVSSGRGFLVLQEVVDSLLMPTLLAFEEASEEIDRRCLILVQRHYREERTIKIKGEQGKWQIKSFKGSDLVEGLDVRVQTGSSFPWNRSAKMDTALSLLEKLPQLGMNNEGKVDPVRVQKILDVGGIGVFQSEGDPDALEIEREHAMFEAFNPDKGSLMLPSLGFWQTHPVHLERHFDFIKTSYMRIAEWHPAAQRAFLDHCLQTMKAVQQIVQQVAPPTDAGDPNANGGAPPGGGGNDAGMTKKGASGIKKTDLKVTRGDMAAAGR